MRKGGARKGGNGKGYKGYKRFVPSWKKKGGKGQAKISQEGTANLSKGKGKGKGKKGKSKGQMSLNRRQEAKEKVKDPRHGPPQMKYPLWRLIPPR